MTRLIILAMLMLLMAACSASITDARPTAAAPQPQAPQVIVVQSAPPTVINANDNSDTVLITILVMAGLVLTALLAFMAGWESRRHHERAQVVTPTQYQQLPQQPQIVVISEQQYRRLNLPREVHHE